MLLPVVKIAGVELGVAGSLWRLDGSNGLNRLNVDVGKPDRSGDCNSRSSDGREGNSEDSLKLHGD